MDIFDDVRKIYKNTDLDIVDKDIDDELYNRKKEILENYIIRQSIKDENKYMFYFRDEEKLRYERSLIFRRTFRDKDIYYDTDYKKEVDRDNSGYVLALVEWIKLRRIIPTSGWIESIDTSCCRYRKIKVPDNMNVISRYIEYQTRLGKKIWSRKSKYILVSIDGYVILKPKRKKRLIRKLVKSGANKHKLAKYFKLSYQHVIRITKGIKQKKFKPEKGKTC